MGFLDDTTTSMALQGTHFSQDMLDCFAQIQAVTWAEFCSAAKTLHKSLK